MSKVAYFDCPTGIAGDMCLGAIVDAGVSLDYLSELLHKLGIAHEYQLRAERVHRNGQQATKIHVDLKHPHSAPDPHSAPELHFSHILPGGHSHDLAGNSHLPHRHLPEIESLILKAELPERAAAWSLAVFRRLAEAEGAVHGIPPEQVHFHEVGATDAIVDIVGTCLGLDWLGIDKLYCSALPTGGGTVRAAHGRLPVPVPAVLKLWELRQIPVYSNGIDRELVTPTGAAIVTTLATQFGPPPSMTLLRVGLGAGSLELPIPNVLRLWIGEREERQEGGEIGQENGKLGVREAEVQTSIETIAVLATQIDDLSPQAIGYVSEALLAIGALDVFTQAIGMKKSRPGTLLTVICRPDAIATCERLLFRETTTLGIRRSLQQRHILQRQIQPVQTEYGPVRVKVAWADGDRTLLNVQPEYEDCAQLARQHDRPWREVHQLTLQTWQQQQGDR